ncbi:hypothetical protein IKE83_02145 [Candidatus Saccharibacteria bacterium]|nr:hypothetical protein [Candidatus Saccharibacteria bacterium]
MVGKADDAGKIAVLNVCQNRTGPIKVVISGLHSPRYEVAMAAAKACYGKGIPLDTVKAWWNSDVPQLRAAAVYALGSLSPMGLAASGDTDKTGRSTDVRLNSSLGSLSIFSDESIIREALTSGNVHIRDAAENVMLRRGVAPLRDVRVPEFVYTRCIGGMVAAAIADDASVIMVPSFGCYRADKVEIVGVMGDFYGENIAFSPRNFEIYRLGTKIVIRDFDYRRGVAGPGFYFSRTEDAAEICYRKMVGGR